MTKAPIYMDYSAHAPLEPAASAAMVAAFDQLDANPHASSVAGEAAMAAVTQARAEVAGLLGARPNDIVFTSGATEANNLALFGLAGRLKSVGRTRLLVSSGEHPSVLSPAGALGAQGFEVEHIALRSDGQLNLDDLDARLGPDVGLVSVAAANHEVGALQPMELIAERTRACGALLHSDLAQAAGKLTLKATGFDLASLSAHKLGGPTGIGALFVSRPLRRWMAPHLLGGGQEGGLRSGTLSPPLCVGFGVAAVRCLQAMSVEAGRVAALRDRLFAGLAALGGVAANGGMARRLSGNLNVRIDGVDAEALVLRLRPRLSISTGSACAAHALEPSHVLTALGLRREAAESSVRISLGRRTTSEEVDHAITLIGEAVRGLRDLGARGSLRTVAA